jgi:hypothetical protein
VEKIVTVGHMAMASTAVGYETGETLTNVALT